MCTQAPSETKSCRFVRNRSMAECLSLMAEAECLHYSTAYVHTRAALACLCCTPKLQEHSAEFYQHRELNHMQLLLLTHSMCALQSRAEDYSETLTFVHLLNALWRASGPSIQDGGRAYAHFSQFVVHSVLVPSGRRHYK